MKEILFTNLLYSHCSCLLVSPTKTLYSNTLQIGIHSQITRKSLNNHLPSFSGLVLCNYRQYILESQLNYYFEYSASKGQQAKMQIETSILIYIRQLSELFASLRQKLFHTIVPDIDELFRLCPFINILG